jgi:hypothetical protein
VTDASSVAVGDLWRNAILVSFPEAPPRRRMTRPLRQTVDLKFVRSVQGGEDLAPPLLYTRAGKRTGTSPAPGRLLNAHA